MTHTSIQNSGESPDWAPTRQFTDFVRMCGCGLPHLSLASDPDSFSMDQRGGRMAPVTLHEVFVKADMSLDCGDQCCAYRVFFVRSGRAQWMNRGVSLCSGAGAAAVFAPDGRAAMRWHAGTKISLFKIDRWAVEEALRDALSREVLPHNSFAPLMAVESAAARNWISMLRLFTEQFFHPDGLVNQPLVGKPFVDSLVRGFLMAADHSHRDALSEDGPRIASQAIRIAVDVIEAEAHLPLTLSSIAARCRVSVRSLQQGFKNHLDTSPMAYLRDVRMRRAHQALLDSDPSTVTVASVAHDWGFTNLGRFAAAHADRYREAPGKTLRRSA